jgi:hypothetical protein
VAYFHQGEAEQVQPLPAFRRPGPLVAGGQPDAPSLVPQGSLGKDPAARAGQEVPQLRVLAELGHVPGDHHIEAVLGQRCSSNPRTCRPSALAAPGCGAARIFAADSVSPDSRALAAIM